jgi:hypothetical protein
MENELDSYEHGFYDFNVEYYGADFPVDVLVKRMNDGDFIIPGFQRKYVWAENEASRFIESLLLGLPTPSIFLAKDKYSQQYLVIDGQQRLRTMQYFYAGSFPAGKKFRLRNVVPDLRELTYMDLPPAKRRTLDNSVIHCIIISESYDSSAIFYLFERLNTTGTPLNAQEIRNAIYHGPFSELLQHLSENESWKHIYGKEENRMNDQELILRFLAFHYNLEDYGGNIIGFLNDFMLRNRTLEHIAGQEMKAPFLDAVSFLDQCIGSRVFRYKNSFNRILFDSVMYAAVKNVRSKSDCDRFLQFYERLSKDEQFWSLAQHSTTNRRNVFERFAYVDHLYEGVR